MNRLTPIEAMRALVVRSVAYFGVIMLGLSRRLRGDQLLQLDALCRQRPFYKPYVTDNCMPVICVVNGERVTMCAVITLFQPSFEDI